VKADDSFNFKLKGNLHFVSGSLVGSFYSDDVNFHLFDFIHIFNPQLKKTSSLVEGSYFSGSGVTERMVMKLRLSASSFRRGR